MTRLSFGLVLGVAFALLSGACTKQPIATPGGSYALRTEDTFLESFRALRAAGRVPLGSEDLVRQQLGRMQFDLELLPDAKFTAHMGVPGEARRYSGTWSWTKERLEIKQTHAGDAPVPDRMLGTLDGDVLRLEHEERGLRMPYVLVRTPATPPR